MTTYAKQTSTKLELLQRERAEGYRFVFKLSLYLILKVFVRGTQHYFDEAQRSCGNHATNKQTIDCVHAHR